MTFILVIVTFVILFGMEFFRRSRKDRVKSSVELVTEHPNSFDVFDRYFHPGHTWALVCGSRSVTLGIDDFSARMIGKVASVDLPTVGQVVHQGEPFTCLRHGTRSLVQVAPVSGRVIEINRRLAKNPGLLNDSPMEKGWIARVLPTSLDSDLRNLLKGFAADGWRDVVREKLIQLFSPRPDIVLQDGGQLVPNLGDHFSDDDWNLLVRQFFPGSVSFQTNDNITN